MVNEKNYKLVLRNLERIKAYDGESDLSSIINWWNSLEVNYKLFQSYYEAGDITLAQAIYATTSGTAQTWGQNSKFKDLNDVKVQAVKRWGPAYSALVSEFDQLIYRTSDNVYTFCELFEMYMSALNCDLTHSRAIVDLYSHIGDGNLVQQIRSKHPKSYEEAKATLTEITSGHDVAVPFNRIVMNQANSAEAQGLRAEVEQLTRQLNEMKVHMLASGNTDYNGGTGWRRQREGGFQPGPRDNYRNNPGQNPRDTNFNNVRSQGNSNARWHAEYNNQINQTVGSPAVPPTASTSVDNSAPAKTQMVRSAQDEIEAGPGDSVFTLQAPFGDPINPVVATNRQRRVPVDDEDELVDARPLQPAPPVGPRRAQPLPLLVRLDESTVSKSIAERVCAQRSMVSLGELYTLGGTIFRKAVQDQFNRMHNEVHGNAEPRAAQARVNHLPTTGLVVRPDPLLTMSAIIADQEVDLTLDTGAQYNVMTLAAVSALRLRMDKSRNVGFRGVDGTPQRAMGTIACNIRMGTGHTLVTHQQFIVVDDQDMDGYTILCGLPFMNSVDGIVNLRDKVFTATQDGSISVNIPLSSSGDRSKKVNVIRHADILSWKTVQRKGPYGFTHTFLQCPYGHTENQDDAAFVAYLNMTGLLDHYSVFDAIQLAQESYHWTEDTHFSLTKLEMSLCQKPGLLETMRQVEEEAEESDYSMPSNQRCLQSSAIPLGPHQIQQEKESSSNMTGTDKSDEIMINLIDRYNHQHLYDQEHGRWWSMGFSMSDIMSSMRKYGYLDELSPREMLSRAWYFNYGRAPNMNNSQDRTHWKMAAEECFPATSSAPETKVGLPDRSIHQVHVVRPTSSASLDTIPYNPDNRSDDSDFESYLEYMMTTGQLDGYGPEEAVWKAQEIFYNLTPTSSCCDDICDDWDAASDEGMSDLVDMDLNSCMMLYLHEKGQDEYHRVLTAAEFNDCFVDTVAPASAIVPTSPITSTTTEKANQQSTGQPVQTPASRACADQFAAYEATLKPELVVSGPSDPRLPEQQVRQIIVPGFNKPVSIGSQTPQTIEQEFIDLLQEFPDVIAQSLADLKEPARFPPMEIKLKPDAKPYKAPMKRRPPAEQAIIDASIEEQYAAGIISPVISEWRSDIFMVDKELETGVDPSTLPLQDRKRSVVSYVELNRNTELDAYPPGDDVTTTIEEASQDASLWSLVDVKACFWACQLHPESRKYTAFASPKHGLMAYNRCAMGLKGSPAHWQRCCQQTIAGLEDVKKFVDDLICKSGKKESQDDLDMYRHQLSVLRQLFQRLRTYRVKISLHKSTFFATCVRFTGAILRAGTVTNDPQKTAAVDALRPQDSLKKLQQFLGFITYYGRWHIYHLSAKTAPLRDLVKNPEPWRWTPQHAACAERLRREVKKDVVRHTPDWTKPFILSTDYSCEGVAAILSQKGDDKRKYYIFFASRATTQSESKLSAYEGELTAVKYGLGAFHHYLWGRQFILYTDHAAMTHLNQNASRNTKLGRLATLLQSEYDFIIEYKKGRLHSNVDALSRNPAEPGIPEVTAPGSATLDVDTCRPFVVENVDITQTTPVEYSDIWMDKETLSVLVHNVTTSSSRAARRAAGYDWDHLLQQLRMGE